MTNHNSIHVYRCLFAAVLACMSLSLAAQQDRIAVHAHRGFRALMPENTIPAMKNALDRGAAWLEMDVCFSKDKQAVVSHDPWLDSALILTKTGAHLPGRKMLALYQLPYRDIRSYRLGKLPHPDFAAQQQVESYLPLFTELVDSVENYARLRKYAAPRYNIETKTNPERDGLFQPAPEEFVKRLMALIYKMKIQDRVMIQSFDPRTLELIRKQHPSIPLTLLTTKGSLDENLAKLSFAPDYYCPAPKLIDDTLVRRCREKGIKLIGGNTNSKKEIERIIKLGVTAFISDYPYPR